MKLAFPAARRTQTLRVCSVLIPSSAALFAVLFFGFFCVPAASSASPESQYDAELYNGAISKCL